MLDDLGFTYLGIWCLLLVLAVISTFFWPIPEDAVGPYQGTSESGF